MSFTFIASAGNFAAGAGTILDCSAPLNVQADDLLVCAVSWATTNTIGAVAEAVAGNVLGMNTKYVAGTPGYLNMGYKLQAEVNAAATFRLTTLLSVSDRAIVVMQFRPTPGDVAYVDVLNKGDFASSSIAKSLTFATPVNSVIIGAAVNAAAVGYLFELVGFGFADGFLRQGGILTEFYKILAGAQPSTFAEADLNSSSSWVADAMSFHSDLPPAPVVIPVPAKRFGTLPEPFKDYIPKAYLDDSLSDNLSDKADETIQGIFEDICNLSQLIDPARIPSEFLEELGYFLNAGLLTTDSDRTKREKVYGAIESHRRRGSWTADVKPKIDSIAGGDAVLLSDVNADDSIIPGDGFTVPAVTYWSAIGADGIDLGLGFFVSGDGDNIFTAGNIFIDVDNPALTADQIEQIVLSIIDSVPAYYRVHLGYVVAGSFVEYTVIG